MKDVVHVRLLRAWQGWRPGTVLCLSAALARTALAKGDAEIVPGPETTAHETGPERAVRPPPKLRGG